MSYPMMPWGSLVEERGEMVNELVYPPLSVGKAGVTPQLDNIAKAKEQSARKIVRKGDLVINQRSDRRGASGLSSLDGTVSVVYSVMRPLEEVFDGAFAHHLLRSTWFQEEFYRYGTGIVADLWSTRFERMRQIRVPLPPLATQRSIADYLDRETGEIDAMLAKLEELVRLLEERRKANIIGLITGRYRKLNLETDLPENWRWARLAHVVTFGNGQDYKSVENSEGPYPVYGSGGEFSRADSYLYDGDSILFGRKGTVDKPIHVSGKFWTVDTMYYTVPGPFVNSRFVHYWATTIPFSTFVTQTAVPSTTSGDLGRQRIPLPPLDEQERIVAHLDDTTVRIDSMIAKAHELRDLLTERRSALITAAVTGQVEIG